MAKCSQRWFSFSKRKSFLRDLIHDAPEDDVLQLDPAAANANAVNNQSDRSTFHDSVIIMGASGSGKSLLFHKLTCMDGNDDATAAAAAAENIDTVTSLKANIQIVTKPKHSHESVEKHVRIVDYPGHKTLFSKLPSLLLPRGGSHVGPTRAILVVDSTKSVVDTGWILYKILTDRRLVMEWKEAKDVLKVMVVCNKIDEVGAKNWRRIKIQLRNELESLKRVSGSLAKKEQEIEGLSQEGEEKDGFVLVGKSIDLDDLTKNGVKGVELSFMSVSAKNGDGLKELRDFVMDGGCIASSSS